MNLRILKKLSKQAVPFLLLYGRKHEEIFFAEKDENYHGLNIRCTHLRHPGRFRCSCYSHPLKGTPMTGEVSGYYEPEWDERTTFSELREFVRWSGRPPKITDKEWIRLQRLVRTRPVTEEEMRQWASEAA